MTVNRYQIMILLAAASVCGSLITAVWTADLIRISTGLFGLAASAAFFFWAADKQPAPATNPIDNDETLIDLSDPETEKKILAGELTLTPGQIVAIGGDKFGAFVDIHDNRIRVIPADSPEQAEKYYQAMLAADAEQAQSPPQIPQPATKPELDETMLDGYKPERWMLKERAKIEQFFNRKLRNMPTKGALPQPWVVGEVFAALNSFSILIDCHGQTDILYQDKFKTHLFSKLPAGSYLIKADSAKGRRYPSIVIPRDPPCYIPTTDAINKFIPYYPQRTTAMIGFDTEMRPVALDFTEAPHIAIIGDTNSGKGVLAHNMLLSLMAKNSPQEMQFVRCDPKGNELTKYDSIPHMLGECAVTPLDCMDTVDQVVTEMTRRYELMRDAGVEDIVTYNHAHKKNPLPRIVLIFDEMAKFFSALNSEEDNKKLTGHVKDALNQLYTAARASGVHLILITQTGETSVLKSIFQPITSKVLLKVDVNTVSKMIRDNGEFKRLETLKGKGHGLLFSDGKTIEFQAPSTIVKEGENVVMNCHKTVINAIKRKWENYTPAELICSEQKLTKGLDTNGHLKTDDWEFYLPVIEYIVSQRKMVQRDIEREFGFGGGRYKRIENAMEYDGFISESKGHGRARDILITPAKLAKLTGETSAKLPDEPANLAAKVLEFRR